MEKVGDEKQKTIEEQMDQLARDILTYCRNILLVHLRFLDGALYQFTLEPARGKGDTLATDGRRIFYNARYVLETYKIGKEQVTRDYLHMALHCVFTHPFVGPDIRRWHWDLACDIAIENAINDMGLPSIRTDRQQKQQEILAELKEQVKIITAEKVYRYYLDQDLDELQLVGLRKVFRADDHQGWYEIPRRKFKEVAGKSDQGDEAGRRAEENEETGIDPRSESGEETDQDLAESREEDWKKIAERMQVDLETLSKEWGDRAAGMMQNLRILNRQKVNYTQLLRRFMALGETMQVSDEEFDYIFYTYGLSLYKKMPLVEPLEYKETKKIKEFVIAIDTSGSCSGETVQKFVQKTYNILRQEENFFTKVNLHIIQCDMEVQSDVKITSAEEMEYHLQNMELFGLGGTDFRPVFDLVDRMIEDREFDDLRGLIYFTDGYGIFPPHMPAYETAFVFLEDDGNLPEVPSWATPVVMAEEDLDEAI